MRRVLHAFNFREVQTPTFEDLELFEKKAGPAIKDEIYAFKDKGERELCLRPELTLPVMRFYFTSELKMEPKPLKLFYFGPCYRYDRPQAGRYREFWQLGTEVVGDASPEAHAELLALALHLFDVAGLHNVVLRIGHLAILRGLLETLVGIPVAQQGSLMRLIDKKQVDELRVELRKRAPAEAVERFLAVFGMTSVDQLRGIELGEPAQKGVEHLRRVLEVLDGFGATKATIQFDPSIARGLEYYSGLVFELDCPDLGAEKQLLGGGEYDLSAVFDAQPVPTVGFGLGFDRTLIALERTGKPLAVDERVDVLVAALSPPAAPAAQRVAQALRGLDLSVELDLGGRGPKKALQRGSAVKARSAVLLGERELERRVATLKNMESGEQKEVPLDALAAAVQALLVREPAAKAAA